MKFIPRLFPALLVPPFLLTALPTLAGTCNKSNGNCSSATTISLHTGVPPILCQLGDDVLEVSSSAECNGISAGPVQTYRCSSSSTPLIYSGGGFTHIVRPKSGDDWGDAAGDCDDLRYSVVVSP